MGKSQCQEELLLYSKAYQKCNLLLERTAKDGSNENYLLVSSLGIVAMYRRLKVTPVRTTAMQ